MIDWMKNTENANTPHRRQLTTNFNFSGSGLIFAVR